MATRKYIALAAVVLAVVGVDQATKYLAVARLTRALDVEPGRGLLKRAGDFYRLRALDPDAAAAADPAVAAALPAPSQPDLRRPSFVVVPGFWTHRYVENPGAAWGMLARLPSDVRVPFFHAVTLLAIVFIGLFYRRLGARQRLLGGALALVLGGAIGNYIDRLARGYVIDFIDWHWRSSPDLHWPTFNLADAAISVGVVLMLIDSLRPRRDDARTRSEAGAGVDGPRLEREGDGGGPTARDDSPQGGVLPRGEVEPTN